MKLTPAQKTLLKVHLAANTNLATRDDGSTFTINAPPEGIGDPTVQGWIANWYNGAAVGNDSQPFANRAVWSPGVTMRQHNSAMDYTIDPIGADQPAQTNNWLRWQTLIWAGQANLDGAAFDMTDPQVRAGILKVWGDTAAGNAKNLGAVGCGTRTGTRFELVVSNAPVGASVGTAFSNAHVVQKDALGALLYGQLLTATVIADAILNG